MTKGKVVNLAEEKVHGRPGGVARTPRKVCMDAQGEVRGRPPGSSYKESPLLSSIISPVHISTKGTHSANGGTGAHSTSGETIREREVQTSALRQACQRSSERFLKGPVPVRLIAAAGELPGRALLVLLAIHHRVTLTGKPLVSLPASVLTGFGFDRYAKARALRELERAGLIRVRRVNGRAALVGLARARKILGADEPSDPALLLSNG